MCHTLEAPRVAINRYSKVPRTRWSCVLELLYDGFPRNAMFLSSPLLFCTKKMFFPNFSKTCFLNSSMPNSSLIMNINPSKCFKRLFSSYLVWRHLKSPFTFESITVEQNVAGNTYMSETLSGGVFSSHHGGIEQFHHQMKIMKGMREWICPILEFSHEIWLSNLYLYYCRFENKLLEPCTQLFKIQYVHLNAFRTTKYKGILCYLITTATWCMNGTH